MNKKETKRTPDVDKLRREIDSIDAKILGLLNARAAASQGIGKIKLKDGQGVYAPHREKEVLDRLKSSNSGPLTPSAIDAIYREIMSSSISLEKAVRIAYLGPQFTFTHQAALSKFGASVEYFPCTNISDVFTEVERGRCDYGVIPVENSTEGAVNYTLDIFIESHLKICAELYLAISHHLLSNAASIKKINQVYSIPQALAQAVAAGLIPRQAANAQWDGAVALGCVIRGETSHYDIVCNNANHWLMEVAVRNNVPLGNGILTVDNEAQAMVRARGGANGKGGDAARACLRLIELVRAFEVRSA